MTETPSPSEDTYDLRDIARLYHYVSESLLDLHNAVCAAEKLKDLESDHFELAEYHRVVNEAYEEVAQTEKALERVLEKHGLLQIVDDYNEHYTKRR